MSRVALNVTLLPVFMITLPDGKSEPIKLPAFNPVAASSIIIPL